MEPNSTLPMNSEGIVVTKERKYKKYFLLAIPILLIALVGMVVYGYIQNKQMSEGLKGVYITDIKDQSAVVSWVTSDPSKTELLYSTEELNFFSQFSGALVGYDRRDYKEVGDMEYKLYKRGNYYVHSVLLTDLEPESAYNFKIKNNFFLSTSEYIDSFETTSISEEMSTPDVIYGGIVDQDGNTANDTLVLIHLTNEDDTNRSQIVSYVMDGNTGWTLDVANLLDEELDTKYVKGSVSYVSIQVVNSKDDITKVVDFAFSHPTANISVYSNEYEFSDNGGGVQGLVACAEGDTKPGVDGSTLVCDGGVWVLDADWEEETGCEPADDNRYETTTQVCNRTCDYNAGEWNDWVCTSKIVLDPECNIGATRTQEANGELCRYFCDEYLWVEVGCEPVEPEEGVQDDGEDDPYNLGLYVNILEENCASADGNYFCHCYTGGSKASCLPAVYLRDEFQSSCANYCTAEVDLNTGEGTVPAFEKTQFCGEGDLATCTICHDMGEEANDRCMDLPAGVPEVKCWLALDEEECEDMGGICTWSSGDKCVRVAALECRNITSERVCGTTSGCEYRNGACNNRPVTFGDEGEMDGYSTNNPQTSEFCTNYGGITVGTNMQTAAPVDYVQTHVDRSSCAIDIGIPCGTPLTGGQIEGYSSPDINHVEWANGYVCEAGEDSGFGCYVDVTNPSTGETVRYGHLTCGENFGCNTLLMSGDSGNSYGCHLHEQVLAGEDGITNNCRGDENPCLYIVGGCYRCNADVSAQAVAPEEVSGLKPVLIKNIVSKAIALESVLGEEESTVDEWIDPLVFVEDLELQSGTYTYSTSSATRTKSFIKTDTNHVVFFSDENGDGVLGEDEPILSPNEIEYEYDISFARVADAYRLVLQEGLNLVSFPAVFIDSTTEEEVQTASELLKFLNEGGAQLSTIAAYRDGIFLSYVDWNENQYGEDFSILPGEGYFVISHSEGVFLYSGYLVENGLEVGLQSGWNLINIYKSDVSSYSAFDVLSQMKNQEVEATTISKWEDGKYTSVVEEDEMQYGIDFNVYPFRGYFVRILGDGGRFIPE